MKNFSLRRYSPPGEAAEDLRPCPQGLHSSSSPSKRKAYRSVCLLPAPTLLMRPSQMNSLQAGPASFHSQPSIQRCNSWSLQRAACRLLRGPPNSPVRINAPPEQPASLGFLFGIVIPLLPVGTAKRRSKTTC